MMEGTDQQSGRTLGAFHVWTLIHYECQFSGGVYANCFWSFVDWMLLGYNFLCNLQKSSKEALYALSSLQCY